MASSRTTLKGYFNTTDEPTEAQFAELIDAFQHVDEKLNHGHFILDGDGGNATVREVLESASATIEVSSSWGRTRTFNISRAGLQNPANVYSTTNQPVIRLSVTTGGTYGTHFALFEGAEVLSGGYVRMTLNPISTESAGSTGSLILPTTQWERLKTASYESNSPFAPNEPQPAYSGGYTSVYFTNESCTTSKAETPTASTTKVTRDLGGGCMAELEGADANSATYAFSAGTGTLTLPAGVRMIRATVQGTAGDAAYSGGVYQSAFRFRIIGEQGNTATASLLLRPRPTVVNCEGIGNPISPTGDIVYDDGRVKIHVDEAAAGTVAYVANNLGQTYNQWAFSI
jgi:hypothetical protein